MAKRKLKKRVNTFPCDLGTFEVKSHLFKSDYGMLDEDSVETAYKK